jgi:hypothetical protein
MFVNRTVESSEAERTKFSESELVKTRSLIFCECASIFTKKIQKKNRLSTPHSTSHQNHLFFFLRSLYLADLIQRNAVVNPQEPIGVGGDQAAARRGDEEMEQVHLIPFVGREGSDHHLLERERKRTRGEGRERGTREGEGGGGGGGGRRGGRRGREGSGFQLVVHQTNKRTIKSKETSFDIYKDFIQFSHYLSTFMADNQLLALVYTDASQILQSFQVLAQHTHTHFAFHVLTYLLSSQDASK